MKNDLKTFKTCLFLCQEDILEAANVDRCQFEPVFV